MKRNVTPASPVSGWKLPAGTKVFEIETKAYPIEQTAVPWLLSATNAGKQEL